jgi:hypothetical protein
LSSVEPNDAQPLTLPSYIDVNTAVDEPCVAATSAADAASGPERSLPAIG